MKNLIITICLFLSSYTLHAQLSFTESMNNLPAGFMAHDIAAKSSSEIFMTGAIRNSNQNWTWTSKIYKSIDGGTNWSEVVVSGINQSQNQYSNIYYSGEKLLLLTFDSTKNDPFGDYGIEIYASMDGKEWDQLGTNGLPYNLAVQDIMSKSSSDFYIMGAIRNSDFTVSYKIYKTTNGGISWAEVIVSGIEGTNISYHGLSYTGDKFLMSVLTMQNQIIYTSIDGMNWSKSNNGISSNFFYLHDVTSKSSSEIYLAGFTPLSNPSSYWVGTIYKSTDGGANWGEVTYDGINPLSNQFNRICFTGDRFLMISAQYQPDPPYYIYKIYATEGTPITNQKVISLTGDLSFGEVMIGQPAHKTLTIGNSGVFPLTVSGIELPTGFMVDWTSGTIAAGESKNLNITFAPVEGKSYSGTLTVSGDFTSGTNTITVSGTGKMQAQGIITLTGDLSFGEVSVNDTVRKVLTIGNSGNALFTVSSVELPAGFSADWTSGIIESGKNKEVTVTFAPTEIKDYADSVRVRGDFASGTHSMAVSGKGKTATQSGITLAGDLLFGDVSVNKAIERMLQITNKSTSNITISGLELPAGFSADWTGGTILGGGEQTVRITFQPTEVKTYEGKVIIKGSFAGGKDSIEIKGNGVDATANELIASGAFSFFPNPVHDHLTIRSDRVIHQVIVYNSVGDIVYNGQYSECEIAIDMNKYTKGIYFVKVFGDAMSGSFKIMKR